MALPTRRHFLKNTRGNQLFTLLRCITHALNEHTGVNPKWRTDIYGIAKQYMTGIKRTDFDQIKNMTVDELITEILKPENNIKQETNS